MMGLTVVLGTYLFHTLNNRNKLHARGGLFKIMLSFNAQSYYNTTNLDEICHICSVALKVIEFQLSTAYAASIESIPSGPWTIAALILGLYWGLGGCLDEISKIKFDSFFKSLYTGELKVVRLVDNVSSINLKIVMYHTYKTQTIIKTNL